MTGDGLDPKDMLDIIQRQAEALGRAHTTLQHNYSLIQRQCDQDAPVSERPTHFEWMEAQRSTAEALDEIDIRAADSKKDAPDAG